MSDENSTTRATLEGYRRVDKDLTGNKISGVLLDKIDAVSLLLEQANEILIAATARSLIQQARDIVNTMHH